MASICFNLRTLLDVQLIHLFREFFAEHPEEFGIHKFVAQGIEHTRFQAVTAHVEAIVTSAFIADRRSAGEISRDHGIAIAAAAAFGKPGGQGLRPLAISEEISMLRRTRSALAALMTRSPRSGSAIGSKGSGPKVSVSRCAGIPRPDLVGEPGQLAAACAENQSRTVQVIDIAELIVDKYMRKHPNFLQATMYRSQAVASKEATRLAHQGDCLVA